MSTHTIRLTGWQAVAVLLAHGLLAVGRFMLERTTLEEEGRATHSPIAGWQVVRNSSALGYYLKLW